MLVAAPQLASYVHALHLKYSSPLLFIPSLPYSLFHLALGVKMLSNVIHVLNLFLSSPFPVHDELEISCCRPRILIFHAYVEQDPAVCYGDSECLCTQFEQVSILWSDRSLSEAMDRCPSPLAVPHF